MLLLFCPIRFYLITVKPPYEDKKPVIGGKPAYAGETHPMCGPVTGGDSTLITSTTPNFKNSDVSTGHHLRA